MDRLLVNTIIGSHDITVFWEPVKDADHPDYIICIDGNEAGKTKKTHYELDGLKPGTEHRVEVICNGRNDTFSSDDIVCKLLDEKKRIDVSKEPYNCKGDGETMNTAMLQKAIDDCKADEEVYIPKGVFRTGALKLHGDMSLYIEKDGVLSGTDEPSDYLPKVWSRFEGKEQYCYSSLLSAGELDHKKGVTTSNITIHGEGTIESGGQVLGERIIALETEELKEYLSTHQEEVASCEKPVTIAGRVRPRLIQFNNCGNCLISGLTLKNGACWNVHMIYCDHIITKDCKLISEGVWNGDGWDPDSSTNCTLFNTVFHTGDDAVAIKSGKNPEGNEINRSTEHVRVFDCVCEIGHGIAIGSEISGGINDVKIWDCDMRYSCFGIEIKATKKRGGYVRNLEVSNCILPRVCMHSVTFNDDGVPGPEAPYFENCNFHDLQLTGVFHDIYRNTGECEPFELGGFREKNHEIKNVKFEDIVIGEEGTDRDYQITVGAIRNVSFKNLTVH